MGWGWRVPHVGIFRRLRPRWGLDIYAGNLTGSDKLFRNEGDGTFVDVTRVAGLDAPGHTTHHMFGDVDGDGWPDLVVATRNVDLPERSSAFGLPTRVYRNQRNGTFRDVSADAGIDLPVLPIEGVLLFDADNDGDLDLLLTGIRHDQPNLFFRNRGNGVFDEDTHRSGLAGHDTFALGVTAADFDNDGWQDVLVATAGVNQLFRNRGNGTFDEVGAAAGLRTAAHSFIPVAADLNRDGWLDIAVSNGWSGRPGQASNELWINQLGRASGNASLSIALRGDGSNRDAIGGHIRVVSGALSMTRHVHGGNGYGGGPERQHFGLGGRRVADSVIVTWPSGQVTVQADVPSGSIVIEENAPQLPPLQRGGLGAQPDADLEAVPGTWRRDDTSETLVLSRTSTRLVRYTPATGDIRMMMRDGAGHWRSGPTLTRYAPSDLHLFANVGAGADVHRLGIRTAQGAETGATRTQSYRIQTVSFQSDSIRLSGRVFLPVGRGPHPGVVIVHGSGAQDRFGPFGYYDLVAHRYAQAGFAAITFDKRGVGESGGDWRRASFAELAADVDAAARALATYPGVGDAIGLWGISQAGWVAARAVERRPETAFVVLASAGGSALTPAEQNTLHVMRELAAAGKSQNTIAAAERAWTMLYAMMARASREDAALDSLVTSLRESGVARDLLPPLTEEIDWDRRSAWFQSLEIDFDPRAIWAAYAGPVLHVLGARDLSTPTDTVADRLRSLRRVSARPARTVVHPEADHFLLEVREDSAPPLSHRTRFASDALEATVRWTTTILEPPVDCGAFAARDSVRYVLPFAPDTAFPVTNTVGHYRPQNGGVGLYAIDFAMPVGTPVHAARGGTVVAVRDSFVDGNGKDLEENLVFIRHADGTIGRYFHLTKNGARVAVDDRVKQGQLIALSGNTGRSEGPHLHFDVQQCGPNLPPDYNALPCGQTVPVTFRNTVPHSCGLRAGARYRFESPQESGSSANRSDSHGRRRVSGR